MKILIGTTNENKFDQFSHIFRRLTQEVELLSLLDLDIDDDVREDGETLLENAKKKAKFFAQKSGFITLSDDTGLFVDALGGAPGINAKRWHTGTDRDRCLKLIEKLRDIAEKERTCRYIGAIAVYDPISAKFFEHQSSVEGYITDDFRGEAIFGYDQIFHSIHFGKNYAQLSEDEKMQLSHRGLGVDEFLKSIGKI
ncbi:MAG: non-canonical purine NTP pyrophosphatase [Candidatus Moranbacteria bacterium]|jgi:XTP/dITP diphosphohydrolase|nr:non-canonical purine NTP pyrophosphatase [Candidatus Moranbacteria bacterium]